MFSFQRQQPRQWLDALNRTLLILGVAAWLISLFFRMGTWPRYACTGIMAGCLLFLLIRTLSGNPQRMYSQNQRFLTMTTAVRTFFQNPARAFRERPRRSKCTVKRKPLFRRKNKKGVE